jgi:hypothetical protein
MGFIPFAPDDGFPGIPGFLHGRLAGAIRFAGTRYCLWFGKIPSLETFHSPVLAKARAPHQASFAAVISSTRNPVSAKQKLSPPRLRAGFFSCLSLALVFAFTTISTRGDSLEDGARSLARRTAATIRSASVTCEARNLSSLKEAEFLSFAAAFQKELQNRDVKIVKSEGGASVLLTLSETVDGYTGVVGVQRGESSYVLMESLAGELKSGSGEAGTTMGLQKELMFSQEEPLVDADIFRYEPKYLNTLGKQLWAFYEWKQDKWELFRSRILPRKRIPSRDLRGVVRYSIDATAALFPGEVCRTGIHLPWECEPNKVHLRPSSVDWELIEDKKLPPWLSAAQFEIDGQDALVITGEDGMARVYSQGSEAIATVPGWGSEIASTHSGCGKGWQILVTGKGDWGTPDSLTAMEFDREKLTRVSESIDLPGPIISLHQTTSDKIPDRDMAIAVVHNLHTGFYEIYRITISCPN